jgi:phage-related protein
MGWLQSVVERTEVGAGHCVNRSREENASANSNRLGRTADLSYLRATKNNVMPLPILLFYLTPKGRSIVLEFLDGLDAQDSAIAFAAIAAIQRDFPLKSQVKVKRLRGKIWEICLTIGAGELRIIFAPDSHGTMIILNVFLKKSRKTPRAEIDLAEKRLKEVT